MAIPDKNIKSNPQGPGTQGPNQIAARDARARKERAGGMKRAGGGTAPIRKAQPTRPGRETGTEGDARYNSTEDRWARMTGTGRYANTPEMNWARMTGTGEWADGGGGEARLNRQRMFGGAPQRPSSFGGAVASSSMDRRMKKAGQQNRKAAPRRSASPPTPVARTFGGGSIGADGSYNMPNYGG